jgi:hypothetical protein
MGIFELPVQMSPCLRTFIVSLLDDPAMSAANRMNGLSLEISKENSSPRDQRVVTAHKLMNS